ncbi:MAG TPA: FKBP-type peptidyl-prolyl cis-trans isomerase [Candidatus Acidoferrum sp.]|nr:FKBP-type peptidyl-prolyl cis-trans isomerase [Candidatus Acidoferrum sp.]
MRRPITLAVTTVVAGMMAFGVAQAQQTPPASAPKPAAPKTATKSPAAKAGTTTAKKPAVLTLQTQKDKASYAIGLNIGRSMHKDSVDIDPNIVLRGMKDGLAGAKPLLTDDEARATMLALQAELRKKQEEKLQALSESNKKEGDAFLAENKSKDGVVTLPSGLQYKILTEGTGPKPTPTDSVVCNYKGTLLDNTEFDSSYKRGQPATFPVTGVIKGWTEALQLMPVGSKWQLFIPPDLAYGVRGGPGGGIGPNATLVFEVELLSIQPKAEIQPTNPRPNATPSPTPNPTPNPTSKPKN